VGFGLIVVGIAASYWLVRMAAQVRSSVDRQQEETSSA
jgi:hypothetical protein